MAIDNDKLQQFLGKFVGDLGATVAVGNMVMGHNLGLYKVLAIRTSPPGWAALWRPPGARSRPRCPR